MTAEPMNVRDWQQDQINKLSPYDDDRMAHASNPTMRNQAT